MMKLPDFIGYLNTWSATQRFIEANRFDPTIKLKQELNSVWVDGVEKKVTWKLVLKVRRIYPGKMP